MRTKFSAAVVSVLAAAGLSWGQPDWVSDLGLDFWNVPELENRLHREEKKRVEIEARDARILEHIAMKDRVIDDVIDGRLGVFEAAELFQQLNAGRPEYLSVLRVAHPAKSETEMYCKNVISFVEVTLQDEPGFCARVVKRLTAEMEAWLKER